MSERLIVDRDILTPENKPSYADYSPVFHLHAYQPLRKVNIGGETIFDITGENLYRGGFNEKIWNESYQPVLKSGVLDGSAVGFDFYGSLRDWVKANHPDDWEKFKKIARENKEIVVADPYIHPIFPLLPDRDKRLLVGIGMEAAAEDYGFYPKGFWLPETAVDKKTLNILSEKKIDFVILRDDQIVSDFPSSTYIIPTDSGFIPLHEDHGRESVDNRSVFASEGFRSRRIQGEDTAAVRPGSFINVFTFDSGLSGQVAFGDISDAYRFADRFALKARQNGGTMISVDFETFGHHRGSGSVEFLKYLLNYALPSKDLEFSRIKRPAVGSVRDNSSWSCSHGLGRWTGGCDCDGADYETRSLKSSLYRGLAEKLNDINNELDLISGTVRWEEEFSEWFLSQRENLSAGVPVDTENVDKKFRQKFAQKLVALVGLTSCGWFFGNGDSIERNIPVSCLSRLEDTRAKPVSVK